MKRAILWSAPRRDQYGNVLRDSKCGRFRIVTREMSSSNGHWNARMYLLETQAGKRMGRPEDTLKEAKDRAEYEVNPDWEPSG